MREAMSVMRFTLLGAAGFGIGVAIGISVVPLGTLLGGAVGGAALGLARRYGRLVYPRRLRAPGSTFMSIAVRSEEEGAVRSGVAPALVEAGNFNALSQANLSAVCTTREGRSPDGSARIGNFFRPESVPDYEILDLTADQERAAREGARVAELLVYTRTKSDADYALIARDIKARYSGYDAVVIEYTDLRSEWIPYNGGALIFNTPCGALSLGYVYGPPNSDGFVAEAGAPPPLYPF